jgi:putative membrane protein
MMDLAPTLRVFLSTLIYTVFGVVVFAIAFWAMVKISPFSIRKELEADHNVAVAVLMASVILGLAIIIAAALHG